MSRFLAILHVIFCFDMGVFLFIFPWTDLWSKNYFVHHFTLVDGLARNYFVRGAVSGIGLADVWLAIFELWRLRYKLGLVQSPPSR